MTQRHTPLALVTGGSSGLGRALVRRLDELGWRVVTDARDHLRLAAALDGTDVLGLVGDVTDPDHRAALVAEVDRLGGLDLLVLNASTLGPLPMRPVASYDADELAAVLATNAVAHVDLLRRLQSSLLERDGVVVSLSSDAAVHHYPTWGPYGASKAALDHLVLTTGAETGVTTYALDPGDMRTPMHADAFPGEDISDRPDPASVVPDVLALLERRPAPGRVTVADLRAGAGA